VGPHRPTTSCFVLLVSVMLWIISVSENRDDYIGIVTDLINALPGNSSVNKNRGNRRETVFSMSSAPSNSRNGDSSVVALCIRSQGVYRSVT
jgi:hypothetical protein